MPRVHPMTAWALLGVLTALLPRAVESQIPSQLLERPDATFPEAFSIVSGLRELSDGRVMVADPLGQALTILDLASGTSDTLGGVGAGPAEYRQPDGLFALPADSTLLVDLGNGRLTVISPEGRLGATMPIAQGEPGSGGAFQIALPRAADSRGRIYFQSMAGMRRGGGLPDSAIIARLDRSTGAIDTVGSVKLEERTRATSGGARNENVQIRTVPMSRQDGWAVGWDGSVVVVRSVDYHVEWRGPGGEVRSGPPVSYEPIRIRQADKEAWVERLQSSGLAVMVSVENGRRNMSFSRGGAGRFSQSDPDDYDWPDVMPAFRPTGIRVAPDGEVWVERYGSSGAASVYDVFDRTGRRVRQVLLPDGRELVGFGRGTVYLIHRDEFDLQYLERYRSTT